MAYYWQASLVVAELHVARLIVQSVAFIKQYVSLCERALRHKRRRNDSGTDICGVQNFHTDSAN